MAAHVARRGVLQAGALAGGVALTGGLALTGPAPATAQAAVAAPDAPPFNGTIGEHIRLDLVRGAVIRLTELDAGSRPVRDLALLQVPLAELYEGGRPSSGGNPLRRVCERASALALAVAAANWQVPPRQCVVDGSAVVHPPSGNRVGYKRWVDIV